MLLLPKTQGFGEITVTLGDLQIMQIDILITKEIPKKNVFDYLFEFMLLEKI